MGSEKRRGDYKLSIIIPVHNEEKRLPNCLDCLLKFYDETMEAEIIVSEDGSIDDTFKIAEEYASRNVCVKVVHSEERLGKGGGIINGMQEAVGNLVVFMDVDLSTKPDQISRLEKAIIEGADLAVGSRSLPQSTITQSRSFTRKILAEGFNWLFRLFFQIQIRDTQCGFKMMKNEVSKELMDKIEIKGFAFDVDLIVKAHDSGYKIREVPIIWSPVSGSKIRVNKQVLEMARDLLKIWWHR
ncbi:MAG: glycosyltransferase family 2 protein [Candidatus Bathyarchaeota archaeon]|nr:MAG: glycosyltransferase family 2 protein [Candidatus Bathyarchaeota archaeon]